MPVNFVCLNLCFTFVKFEMSLPMQFYLGENLCENFKHGYSFLCIAFYSPSIRNIIYLEYIVEIYFNKYILVVYV